MRRGSPGRLLATLVVSVGLIASGCGEPDVAAAGPDDSACPGLTPARGLPERVGGFEFGVVHDLGGGSVLDLTDFSGCELPDGRGVVVLREGRFASVYHLDCEHLATGDIPPDVRPEGMWLCYGPGGGFEKSAP